MGKKQMLTRVAIPPRIDLGPTAVENTLVVLRTANERTMRACKHILKMQTPEDRIVIIEERPFSEALRQSFEAGLERGLTWTICLDADVLIAPGCLKLMTQCAEHLEPSAFGFTGYIFDKFLGGKRQGGPHLYRTCLLEDACRILRDVGNCIRPETEVKRGMISGGHDSALLHCVLGVHDYGQYYKDIFRKMVVRSGRSQDLSSDINRAANWAHIDRDFVVAAMGLRYGRRSLQMKEDPILDAAAYQDVAEFLLEVSGIEEKSPIEDDVRYVRSLYAYRINNLLLKRQLLKHESRNSRLISFDRLYLELKAGFVALKYHLLRHGGRGARENG